MDRQIREAQERGEFDNLSGHGKPIPDLDRPYDDLWWIRRKMREENLSYLPPALQIRKDVEEARRRIACARTEREVRQLVGEINEEIRAINRSSRVGPATTTVPLDEELVVREWHQARETG